MEERLHHYPSEGEQEMSEQEECVNLDGDVHMQQETFAAWFKGGAASPDKWPCAAVIHRYAVDQQGVDIRGAVSSDTAWELCCRTLSLRPEQNKLGTRDLAQLLVYWLEEGQVAASMKEIIYHGMEADLRARGKRVETMDDEQLMKCRWLRLAIHAELDAIREDGAIRSG